MAVGFVGATRRFISSGRASVARSASLGSPRPSSTSRTVPPTIYSCLLCARKVRASVSMISRIECVYIRFPSLIESFLGWFATIGLLLPRALSDVGGGIAGSDLPLCLIQDRSQQVQRIYYIMAPGHR